MSGSPALLSTGPTVDVRLSYGPLLIGVLFNMILFGVLVTQIWAIFLVEVANSAVRPALSFPPSLTPATKCHPGQFANHVFNACANSLSFVVFINSYPKSEPLCVVVVGFPIQCFFIWRIRSLTHQNLIPAVILLFSLVSLGGGVWTTVMVLITGKFSRIPMLYRSAQVWLISISAACTDIAIALSLWLALRSKKTGFVLTDHVVDTIIRMTVQTEILTYAVCQSAYSSSFLSQSAVQHPGCRLLPDFVGMSFVSTRFLVKQCTYIILLHFLHSSFQLRNFLWNIPLSELYSNCLMSTLNARQRLNHSINEQMVGGTTGRADVVLTGPMFGGDSKARPETIVRAATMLSIN
ncbi:hypothetical protein B0H16DRAFT_1306820 [Mycena metata]|uniref:DUF6534 domain-containing protein n=1 Tax=Mycena metata TaxID=1033252 RepID=A0AAD7JSD7_9AGAR|nr:hypothetical protein B0H16DRAFT_1306820 [Mycena metata]